LTKLVNTTSWAGSSGRFCSRAEYRAMEHIMNEKYVK